MIALFATGIALLAMPGCKKAQEHSSRDETSGEKGAGAASEVSGETEKESFRGTKELPSSKNVVLGLRIPKGMHPMPAQRGVYRFEGVFPVVQVADYIKEAVEVDVVTQAGHKTFEFRFAKVKDPVGRTKDPAILGIRVTEALPHGSRLDIWIEKQNEAGAAAQGAKGNGARGMVAPPAARLSKGEAQKRAQSRKNTLDAVIKSQNSPKKLSEAERDLLY